MGILLSILCIRLGQLNILPEFGAYLLFLSAIHLLEGQRRDLALLRPLGWLLAAWSGLGWAAELLGAAVNFPVVGIVIGAVQMYFHFQMMTDFAALAQTYQGADQTLDRRLLSLENVADAAFDGNNHIVLSAGASARKYGRL